MEKEDTEMAMDWDSDWKAAKRPSEIGSSGSDGDSYPPASKLHKTDPTLSLSTPLSRLPFPDIDNPRSSYVSDLLAFLHSSTFGYPHPLLPLPDLTPRRFFSFQNVDMDYQLPPVVNKERPTPSCVKLPADISSLRALHAAQIPSPPPPRLTLKAAALLLFLDAQIIDSRDLWKTLRSNGFDLFITAIVAASSLLFKLYSQPFLFRFASEREACQQINTLWNDIEWMRHQDQPPPFSDVCKEVVGLVANNEKYSSITQTQVDVMTHCFSSFFCWRAKPKGSPDHCEYPFQDCGPLECDDEIIGQIVKVLTCMEYPEKEDENRTSWLVQFSREDDEGDDLVDKAMHFVKVATSDSNEARHVRAMLERIFEKAKNMMKIQLKYAKKPLLQLQRFTSLGIHSNIYDVVEVAEVCRMDLGKAYIGRSDLLWAFYQLGYGLHAKDKLEVHADEDHPPYHIYLAAIKLTRLLGETTTQLDHFMFAVIHSKSIGYDGEEIVKFAKIFKDFRERLKELPVDLTKDLDRPVRLQDLYRTVEPLVPLLYDVEWRRCVYSTNCSEIGLVLVKGSENLLSLKRFSKHKVKMLEIEAQVLNEKNLMTSLNNSACVPQILCTCADETHVGILLNASLACPLGSILLKPLDESSARFVAAWVVIALEELHQKGVLYRGVSPDVLMIDQQGHLQFVDFRFGKKLDGERTFTICGMAESVAPEIVLGKGHGVSADWWSLGVLIYFMVLGDMPFGSLRENGLGTLARIAKGQFKVPQSCSPEALDLITKLLEIDEAKRLGAEGPESVKRHPWFAGVDWSGLVDHSIPVPHEIVSRISHHLENTAEDCFLPPSSLFWDVEGLNNSVEWLEGW